MDTIYPCAILLFLFLGFLDSIKTYQILLTVLQLDFVELIQKGTIGHILYPSLDPSCTKMEYLP